MANPVVILFARAPRIGMVKTRLAAGIGARAALRFHRATLAATIRKLDQLRGVSLVLAITPDRARLKLPQRWQTKDQGKGDLGQRMHRAFRRYPHLPVVLVGADIPGLAAADIRCALRMLRGGGAVFGPAADGGYYLVGMGGTRPDTPFANVRWSSPDALADTLANFRRTSRLRTLHDVDTADDLAL
jgi:rSAM/selenodomain-associated transferase 1